jgi:hypothetical protein
MVFSFYAFEPVTPHLGGENSTYLEAGMTIMSAVVFIVNFRVLLLHNTVILFLILELPNNMVYKCGINCFIYNFLSPFFTVSLL